MKIFIFDVNELDLDYVVPERYVKRLNVPQRENTNTLSYSDGHYYKDKLENRNFPTSHPGWDLLRAVGLENKGIGYNPYLTTEHTANLWLQEQQRKNKLHGYNVYVEDLDNDKKTPDDVIVADSQGNPLYVSGYHLSDGTGRRKAAVLYNFYPTRNQARAVKKDMQNARTSKLFEKYLVDQSLNAEHLMPYGQQWVNQYIGEDHQRKPTDFPLRDDLRPRRPYNYIVHLVHITLKEEIDKAHPFYTEIAREIVKLTYNKLKQEGGGNQQGMLHYLYQNEQLYRQYILDICQRVAKAFEEHQNIPRQLPYVFDEDPVQQQGFDPPSFREGRRNKPPPRVYH
jgi:hypothetical protein